jgi:hypothetical protein
VVQLVDVEQEVNHHSTDTTSLFTLICRLFALAPVYFMFAFAADWLGTLIPSVCFLVRSPLHPGSLPPSSLPVLGTGPFPVVSGSTSCGTVRLCLSVCVRERERGAVLLEWSAQRSVPPQLDVWSLLLIRPINCASCFLFVNQLTGSVASHPYLSPSLPLPLPPHPRCLCTASGTCSSTSSTSQQCFPCSLQ